MSFVLKLRDVIVGRSALDQRDAGRRTARGVFRPGLGYDLVEPIFALLGAPDGGEIPAEQRQRYRKARDMLALAVYAPDDTLVETSRIEIVADGHAPTGLALEVTVVDPAFWETRA